MFVVDGDGSPILAEGDGENFLRCHRPSGVVGAIGIEGRKIRESRRGVEFPSPGGDVNAHY